MTPDRIKQFADSFAFHLFDEALLKSTQDKDVVEGMLHRWLMKEFSDVSSKKIMEKDARHMPAKEAGKVEMRGSRPATLDQIHDGEWIEPTPQNNYLLACCKCGTTHRMEFRVVKGKVQFRGWRIRGNK
jgi:hypothetical protein